MPEAICQTAALQTELSWQATCTPSDIRKPEGEYYECPGIARFGCSTGRTRTPLISFRGSGGFAFLYAVVATATVAFVMTISGVAGLFCWQTLLMLIGTVLVGWAVLFGVLEIRRLGKGKDEVEELEDIAAYPSRNVFVAPPTGDACVHHEDYLESQGSIRAS
jgi:hypothetical protein